MSMRKKSVEMKNMEIGTKERNGMKKMDGTITPEKQKRKIQVTALGGMRVLTLWSRS